MWIRYSRLTKVVTLATLGSVQMALAHPVQTQGLAFGGPTPTLEPPATHTPRDGSEAHLPTPRRSEDAVPPDEVVPGTRIMFGNRLWWQAPEDGLMPVMRYGRRAHQWVSTGPNQLRTEHTAWHSYEFTEQPADEWVAGRIQEWIDLGYSVERMEDGPIRISGEPSYSTRIKVVTPSVVQVHILDLHDGMGAGWTCEIERANGHANQPHALAECLRVGTSVHIHHPPPIPPLVANSSRATALRSIPKEHWPCGATNEGRTTVTYIYEGPDQCTLDPTLFIVGCPTTMRQVWRDQAGPTRTIEHTFTYEGDRLVQRTKRTTPSGTRPRRRNADVGETFDYTYTDGRLSQIASTPAGTVAPTRNIPVRYPHPMELVLGSQGFLGQYSRMSDGRLYSGTNGSTQTRLEWHPDGRPSETQYMLGQTVASRLVFDYTCDFPEEG